MIHIPFSNVERLLGILIPISNSGPSKKSYDLNFYIVLKNENLKKYITKCIINDSSEDETYQSNVYIINDKKFKEKENKKFKQSVALYNGSFPDLDVLKILPDIVADNTKIYAEVNEEDIPKIKLLMSY